MESGMTEQLVVLHGIVKPRCFDGDALILARDSFQGDMCYSGGTGVTQESQHRH